MGDRVIVPLQIGVVFNRQEKRHLNPNVLVPLQIGVVFNKNGKITRLKICYRPLTNRGSL